MAITDIMTAALMAPGLNGRWGLPIIFESAPGTAKSSIVDQVAATLDLDPEVYLGSIREPTDVGGIPIPNGDGVLHRAIEAGLAKYIEQPGLIFLDELNAAAPATQKAFLRLVLEGVAGDSKLHPGVRFIAAQNGANEASGIWDLDPALANRFGHMRFPTPTPEEWRQHMMTGSRAPKNVTPLAQQEAFIMSRWPAAYAKSSGAIVAFAQARPELLHKQPKPGDKTGSQAWPSLRTWEMAARALASAEIHGLDAEDTNAMVEAFVGPGAAAEFGVWRIKQDLPNPVDVLDGRVKFVPDHRLDRTAAVLNSCLALVAPEKAQDRIARCTRLWEIIEAAKTEYADIALPIGEDLIKVGLSEGALEKLSDPILASLQGVRVVTR